MFKKMFLLLVIIFMFGTNSAAYAMMCRSDSGHGKHAQAVKNTVNVGNKVCPVTREKINEATKAIYEYKGKIYNFCCASCIDDFKKDPTKYIKKTK